ncbi:MAG: acetylornithine/succinylornithine family transaminase [Ruminococcaceae bacterium]|nr:acetylornithine/succinylornithine family transaminase [Oscillospiraceae bacterium]
MNIFEKDSEFIANTYARFPLALVSGKGSLVYDENGKEYIDLSTGIAVNTFGIADESWIKAITKQLGAIQHASNLYYTEPCTELAELLCERTGLKKVFFSNSGAEANECAIKTARKYACDKKGKDYNVIITLKNSFHGRTITTLAATGQDVFHNDFLPLTDGFVYCEAGNIKELESLVANNKVCAIMFECVQGEGGVLPLSKEFVNAIFDIANKNDILTICDEVQTGNGRTGALYGFMKYGVLPDIVSTAKGLGGGLPLGATMLGEKVKDVLTPSSHGSTFGGNPVACAGAVDILKRIDENLLLQVNKKSQFIVDSLKNASGVKSVSGMGLMLGIETEKDASEVIKYCMDNGVLVIKAKNKVRLLPALNIPQELLEKAVDVIKKGCAL